MSVLRAPASGGQPVAGESDEAALVAQALAGEHEALGVLVTRYAPSVRRVTRAILGDAAEADDAAQDGLPPMYKDTTEVGFLHRVGRLVAFVMRTMCSMPSSTPIASQYPGPKTGPAAESHSSGTARTQANACRIRSATTGPLRAAVPQ